MRLKHKMKAALSTSFWRKKLESIYLPLGKRILVRRIYGTKDGRAPRPRVLYFDVTNRCNLRCKMCYLRDVLNKKDQEQELESEELLHIARRENINRVSLIGGEPFLRKDFLDLLEMLSRNGIICESLTTNGTLIDEKTARRIARVAAAGYLGGITFSIDGPEDIHDAIRGKGTFEKASRGIAILRKALNAAGDNPRRRIVINSVITPENYQRLPEIVSTAKALGIYTISLSHLMFTSKRDINATLKILGDDDESIFHTFVTDDGGIDPVLLHQKLKELRHSAPREGIHLDPRPRISDDDLYGWYSPRYATYGHCTQPFMITRVGNAGQVYFCTFIRKEMGNLRNQSLAEIWNSPDFVARRKSMVKRGIFPVCKRCCKVFLRKKRDAWRWPGVTMESNSVNG